MDVSPLTVSDVTKCYGSRIAVTGLECRVAQKQILGLLGPNGAGKTTALNMIAGVLSPTAGKIFIAGIDLSKRPLSAKRLMGYLPDPPPLYPELTVNEYLHFCARLRGLSGHEARRAVGRAVALCALTQVTRQLNATLSKGFRQRVGIAQAILHQPTLLILDEPSVGLDPWQLQAFRALIQEVSEQCAVLVSTHLLSEVQALCDDVLILTSGRTVFSGSVQTMQTSLRSTVLRVGLSNPPSENHLKTLTGVEKVEMIHHTAFRLHHQAQTQLAAQLAKIAVAQDWGLYELTQEQPGLEQALFELTAESEELR